MSEDFYSRLGVAPDASEDAIRRAYRAKVAEQHPDVSDHPDAEARFRRLNRAKNVLTDQERRRRYDRLGHETFVQRDESEDGPAGASAQPSPERPGQAAGPSPRQERRRTAVGTLLDHEFRIPRFGRWSGQTGTRADRRSDPADPFTVDLASLLRTGGASVREESGRQSREWQSSDRSEPDCPRCGGRGRFLHVIDTARGRRRRFEPCEECGGTGTV